MSALPENIENCMFGISMSLGLIQFVFRGSCMCVSSWIRSGLKEGMMANLDYQFKGFENYHGNKSLSMLVRNNLDQVN